ncbi:MAG: lipopolysaccharide assembly protein LapA domain-containing protein [Proteobacteria bacterium]|nr:lipopolysaccharide assembly protein LapA domain-containing protein [Pseudomonadota bacterium]
MKLIKSTFKYIRIITLALLLTIVVTFCINNDSLVILSLNPLPFEIQTKLFLLLILFFLIGVVVGFLTLSKRLVSSKMHSMISDRKLAKLEKEGKQIKDKKIQD